MSAKTDFSSHACICHENKQEKHSNITFECTLCQNTHGKKLKGNGYM